jgi:hypothetical protein
VVVGDCPSAAGEEEGGKAASAGIEFLGELPGELEQMGEQVVSFVGPELVRITATPNCPGK